MLLMEHVNRQVFLLGSRQSILCHLPVSLHHSAAIKTST